MIQLIIYACPMGPLADQIQAFFEVSLAECGRNAAHAYMPHCTLVCFFEDLEDQAISYCQTLERLYQRARRDRSATLSVGKLTFNPDWYGLPLTSPELEQLAVDFARSPHPASLGRPIRPKSWLHLSLAYGFAPDQAKCLKALAQAINPAAAVSWELRLYQRSPAAQASPLQMQDSPLQDLPSPQSPSPRSPSPGNPLSQEIIWTCLQSFPLPRSD